MSRCGDRSLSTFALKHLQVLVVLTGLLVGINAHPQQADLQAHTIQLQQALEVEDHLKVVAAIQGLRSLGVEDERLDFFEGRAQYHQKQGREAARLIAAYLKASPEGEYAAEARAYCESAYEKLGEGYSYGVNRTVFLYRIAHMKRFAFGGDPQVAEA